MFSCPTFLAGKTEALGEYIAERAGAQPGLRVLVISFRRVLADKMAGELRRAGCDLDFVNYQDIQKQPSFNSDLLVVQLDSLYRVERKLYDIVVLDECQSITMHTCSTIMQQVLPVIQELNWHLINAKQVIMMDACMDSFACTRIVNQLEDVRGTKAFWVCNKRVR